jgi:UDPglucose--hexose-1-phosphate uridylyltransferase
MTIEKTIKEALFYAESHLDLRPEDYDYFQNLLLAHYHLSAPYSGAIEEEKIRAYPLPDPIIEDIIACDLEKGMDEGEAERDSTYVLGLLSPTPHEVDDAFDALYKVSPEKATEYLYQLSIANNYIAKSQVDKNLHWEAKFVNGSPLEISINLSKPEKNNKDIAKLKTMKDTGYPKCLLCKENLGFEGGPSHPARESIRFVPLTLGGERWYLQYSPYVYYSHHCIVFYHEHVPMLIAPKILGDLLDFVDIFPHFFIGSNSDLPIVGGSILNHEHFQGGGHLLPLLVAPDREVVYTSAKTTRVSIVDFYATALKISGADRADVLSVASKILTAWRAYNDPAHQILCSENGESHSTCTPFARKLENGYAIYLILRNNICTKEYPDGLFHAHPEYHHIKKEGIGLIEAAGLFILPARLKRQMGEVEDVVAHRIAKEDYLKKYPDLAIFEPMILQMEKTGESAETYVNGVCRAILENVAVYKADPDGQAGLHAFLKEALA